MNKIKLYSLYIKYCIFGIFIIISHLLFSQSLTNQLKTPAPDSLLSQYLQIRSVQGNEGLAGNFLMKFCMEHGLYIKIFSAIDSAYNYTASLYPLNSQKPNIIFLNHLDVVPANDSAEWKFPPFSGTIFNNEIWGRGAIDCKGLAIMQLMAILNYVDIAKIKELPYNITMLSVSGEETNAKNGAAMLADNYIKELNPVVIFGEGGSGISNVLSSDTGKTIFGISVAEKRTLWLKLEVNSESFAHGAASSELYANKKLLRVLIKLLDEKRYVKFDKVLLNMFHQLGEMEGGIKGFIIKHINWDIFWPLVKKKFYDGEPLHLLVYNTFTITNISNPKGPSNTIAEKASAILDCRLLPGTSSSKFLKKIKNIAGPKVKITVLSENPDSKASHQDKYFDAMSLSLKEIYKNCEVIPVLFPASTDNNYFRNKNIPVFGIVPAILSLEDMQSVHNKDEKISVENLNKGIETFKDFIKKINSLK